MVLFCGLGIASCLTLAFVQQAIASVAGILTLRISNTLFQPLQTEIQNRQIDTENRATALSINSMLVNSVAVGTNLVFGALSDRSLSSAFLFGAGICVAQPDLLFSVVSKDIFPKQRKSFVNSGARRAMVALAEDATGKVQAKRKEDLNVHFAAFGQDPRGI